MMPRRSRRRRSRAICEDIACHLLANLAPIWLCPFQEIVARSDLGAVGGKGGTLHRPSVAARLSGRYVKVLQPFQHHRCEIALSANWNRPSLSLRLALLLCCTSWLFSGPRTDSHCILTDIYIYAPDRRRTGSISLGTKLTTCCKSSSSSSALLSYRRCAPRCHVTENGRTGPWR